jgi:FkbM family methyltransferase
MIADAGVDRQMAQRRFLRLKKNARRLRCPASPAGLNQADLAEIGLARMIALGSVSALGLPAKVTQGGVMAQATTMTFRPGTLDESIFHAVSVHNEYRLPDSFEKDDLIIDIGTHIGSFCHAALQRGAHHVYGFEAEPSNYECAVRNLHSFGNRVRIENRAVWRSDRPAETLRICQSHQVENTGGGNVFWSEAGTKVTAIPFDDIVRSVTNMGQSRVRMVKLDCETSEFPILLTSRTLHLIDSIVGEFHECGGAHDSNPIPEHARVEGYERFTIVELTAALRRAGFDVTHSRMQTPDGKVTNIGPFFADRPARRNRLATLWKLFKGPHTNRNRG